MARKKGTKRSRSTAPDIDIGPPSPVRAGAGGAGAGAKKSPSRPSSAKKRRRAHEIVWEELPAGVLNFRNRLSVDDLETLQQLQELDQLHLFAGWAEDPYADVAKKHAFFKQVRTAGNAYPGGLPAYVKSAKKFLAESAAGVNPFEGCTPEVPTGSDFSDAKGSCDTARHAAELHALDVLKDCAFVLVAGGLGERLGYKGIKVELPSEVTTGDCFLKRYVKSILALQDLSNKHCGTDKRCRLAIMTSEDTHKKTADLLFGEYYYGMDPDHVTLMKQEKVPALIDNDAHIAQPEDDPYSIVTKPHGHGDVHVLLAKTGLVKKWRKAGLKYVIFFQDTNALCFYTIPAALGVSLDLDLEVNSICTTRKAREALGAIARLVPEKGSPVTVNVEYNQLGPLLKATVNPKGDVNDPKTGNSPFPGNTNQLIFELEPYAEVLERTQGLVPEFVNPKYADASKTKFSSPTRLECMMQDHPKLLGPEAKVGFTMFSPDLYSPVKNNLKAAVAKQKAGLSAHCAATGEFDFYRATCNRLREAGVVVHAPTIFNAGGVMVERHPAIVIDPRLSVTVAAMRKLFPCPGAVTITARSTLIIRGGDLCIRSLHLDGALEINAEGVALGLDLGNVTNEGWEFVEVEEEEKKYERESVLIRGYKVEKRATKVLNFDRK